ncbi:uncharacterized protein LOC135225148 [Macrobrachium nipponense]|uniref:uncharacterized protein LOC135225148 n=1 Tax=Macrobrachium nipponense TaxID=159736 RepID=UPI0030C83A9E
MKARWSYNPLCNPSLSQEEDWTYSSTLMIMASLDFVSCGLLSAHQPRGKSISLSALSLRSSDGHRDGRMYKPTGLRVKERNWKASNSFKSELWPCLLCAASQGVGTDIGGSRLLSL